MRFLVVHTETQNIAEDWDTHSQAIRACKTLNNHEEQNGRTPAYFVQPTCPQCDSDDVIRAHASANHAHPETYYWLCSHCSHQWGHE